MRGGDSTPRSGARATRALLAALLALGSACGDSTPNGAIDAALGHADAPMSVDAGPDGGSPACKSDVDCTDAKRPRCDVASKRCVACLPGPGDACAAGTYCDTVDGAFACVPGCKSAADCATGADASGAQVGCCKHQCVDTSTSAANCGGCGMACVGAERCCAAACVDTTTSPTSCGACGKACMVKNGAPACVASACAVGSCDPGFADCNGDPADGCETPTADDPANCGACKKTCPTMVPFGTGGCAKGQCAVTGCTDGHAHCGSDPAKGCETDLASDVGSCGACGKACALANATPICAKGSCAVKACLGGFADCDGDPSNGCESDPASDPFNCGGCGMKCPAAPNVVALCTGGACSTGGCKNGFADCNHDPDDGCEVDIANDLKNCGACGKVCPPSMQGTVTCSVGGCYVINCPANTANCDGDPKHGCDKNLLTDPANCGACAKACVGKEKCLMGKCQVMAPCDPHSEISFMGHCYYLDGSGGTCDAGYARAPESVLAQIASQFQGRFYKHTNSQNCCIWTSDPAENYGMTAHCNADGPFSAGEPSPGGSGCTNQMNHNIGQLTFCGSL